MLPKNKVKLSGFHLRSEVEETRNIEQSEISIRVKRPYGLITKVCVMMNGTVLIPDLTNTFTSTVYLVLYAFAQLFFLLVLCTDR